MGLLGSIIAVCKTVIKNNSKLKKYEADELYKKIITSNKFIDIDYNYNDDFESNNELSSIYINNYQKMKNIKKYLEYQIVILSKECFSVFLVPFVLIYLCNYIENIVNLVEKLLIHDEIVGLIDKKSHFRLINNKSNKKSLLSFEEFRSKYPLWGSNIELYQVSILDKNTNDVVSNYDKEDNKKKIKNYSIFDHTFDSEISII